MTDTQRTELARQRAKAIVARLRASNEREAKRTGSDGPEVDYNDLERLMTRKLLRV